MRLLGILVLFLSLATFAFAWTKEDHEIFDLVSALELAEGKGTSFYSFLNVTPTATLDQINKAYRKRSLALHPDKNRNVPDIQARFARLGVITNILRNSEERKRYDHFFKNGIPRWRGTGYYYARYRPTLAHVLLFLVFLTSIVHYIILYMREKKDVGRVEWFERRARELAFPGLSSTSSGSGTSTPALAEKAEVLSSVMDQLDDDEDESPIPDDTPQQKITRRQARSREGKKELAKQKAEKEQVKAQPAKVVAPVVPEPSEKRRKVKVPYVEDASAGGPMLDLIVNGDGVVMLPGDISLRSQIRPVTFADIWPVAIAKTLYAKVVPPTSSTETLDDVEDEEETETAAVSKGKASRTKKNKALQKRVVNGKK